MSDPDEETRDRRPSDDDYGWESDDSAATWTPEDDDD